MYVFVRLFRHTNRMHQRDWRAWSTWVVILVLVWVIAWIIAEAIPVFNNLLSLVVCLAWRSSRALTDEFSQASLFASWSTCMYRPNPLSSNG